ncbi:MAG: NADH-quinone oxidoreductase subunit C, partial [Hyphomicrobium sp.]
MSTVQHDPLGTLGSHISRKMHDKHGAAHIQRGELTLTIEAGKIVETLTFLRDDPKCQFEILIDICGVDFPA